MFRVMTYNILHAARIDTKDYRIDHDKVAETIREINADVIVLNEVRGEGPDPGYTAQAKIISEKLGYYYFFAPAIMIRGKLPYGNALLSKYPIVEAEIIEIPDPVVKDENRPYETRCLISAKIEFEGKQLMIFGTHFGLAKAEQKNAVATVVQEFEKCFIPHIFMGDLNVTPNDTVLEPIFKIMHDTAEELGDLKLSFPNTNPNIKIDYIMVSNDIKVKKAEILQIGLSDHLPVYADIEF